MNGFKVMMKSVVTLVVIIFIPFVQTRKGLERRKSEFLEQVPNIFESLHLFQGWYLIIFTWILFADLHLISNPPPVSN